MFFLPSIAKIVILLSAALSLIIQLFVVKKGVQKEFQKRMLQGFIIIWKKRCLFDECMIWNMCGSPIRKLWTSFMIKYMRRL